MMIYQLILVGFFEVWASCSLPFTAC